MKNIFFIALALIPALASADYKLGTNAQYGFSLAKKDAPSTSGSLKLEVTAVDEKQKTVEITSTQTIAGDTKIEKDINALSDLDEGTKLIAELVKTCTEQGGTPEKISTPAGELDTCKMTGETDEGTETTWWGNVPFYIVKTVQLNKSTGDTAVIILNSIHE